MMTPEAALAALRAEANPELAASMVESLKTDREVLGLRTARITELATEWRQDLSIEDRVCLADALWQSNIHEARVAATKLLVQARIRPDAQVWALITSWLPDVDGQVLADLVADAGARRLAADPTRLDEMEAWVKSPHVWTRRAALSFTLPMARANNLKPAEAENRARVLTWAGMLSTDKNWFVQKTLAQWLRDLSKHDAAATADFLLANGETMKKFVRKEAGSLLE